MYIVHVCQYSYSPWRKGMGGRVDANHTTEKVWYSSFYFLITLSLFNLHPIGTKGSIHCNVTAPDCFISLLGIKALVCDTMLSVWLRADAWQQYLWPGLVLRLNAKSPSTKTQEERYNSNPFCLVELENNTTHRNQTWFSA
jgi:hypothetical protein